MQDGVLGHAVPLTGYPRILPRAAEADTSSALYTLTVRLQACMHRGLPMPTCSAFDLFVILLIIATWAAEHPSTSLGLTASHFRPLPTAFALIPLPKSTQASNKLAAETSRVILTTRVNWHRIALLMIH
jgi:hypothetical protein